MTLQIWKISKKYMEQKKIFNKRGSMAISQIIILIVGIVAIGYAIGSNIKEVGGISTTAEAALVKKLILADAAKLKTANPSFIKGAWVFYKNLWGAKPVYAGLITLGVILLTILVIKNKDAQEVAKDVGYGLTAAWALGKLGVGSTLSLIGGGVLVVVLLAFYRKETQQVVTFTCLPWEAQTKGDNCELCNKEGELPCSEYQCRSLGQSCKMINVGSTDEKCVWVNPQDINPPTIKPREASLISNDYVYDPITTFPNREDRGTELLYNGGCVPAFTPFSFGIELNDEPGRCKLDIVRKDTFEDMDFFFSEGLLLYNHTFSLSLPGSAAFENENVTVQNDGEYEIYARCQDANENTNVGNFVFKYCVQKGPDTTPPYVVSTNYLSDKEPIGYGQENAELVVYTNEPATCKWSQTDQNYKNMENAMEKCSTGIFQNLQNLYSCTTTLTGLNDGVDNKFYVRCKDQPILETANGGKDKDNRVEMRESYEMILEGTRPLVISSVEPNGTIKDSTDVVKVTLRAETSAGYKEGESICSYGKTEQAEIDTFFNTNSYTHSTDLRPIEGSYNYFIKCVDAGGNFDVEEINFNVETDTTSPIVVRAFKEEGNLRITTSEDAKCFYSTSEDMKCSYDGELDGLDMIVVDDVDHFTSWNTNTNFYIKCVDEYGNQPNFEECSIIIKPLDLNSE